MDRRQLKLNYNRKKTHIIKIWEIKIWGARIRIEICTCTLSPKVGGHIAMANGGYFLCRNSLEIDQ